MCVCVSYIGVSCWVSLHFQEKIINNNQFNGRKRKKKQRTKEKWTKSIGEEYEKNKKRLTLR